MTEENTQLQNPSPEEAPEPLIFTDACVAKVKELLAAEEDPNMPLRVFEEGNPNLKLRVFVQGGGCQGFQYGFQFEEKAAEDDEIIERDGVTFLVDSLSMQYLVGAEIDFKEDLEGSQFVIRNPNAVTSCSCGSSFSV